MVYVCQSHIYHCYYLQIYYQPHFIVSVTVIYWRFSPKIVAMTLMLFIHLYTNVLVILVTISQSLFYYFDSDCYTTVFVDCIIFCWSFLCYCASDSYTILSVTLILFLKLLLYLAPITLILFCQLHLKYFSDHCYTFMPVTLMLSCYSLLYHSVSKYYTIWYCSDNLMLLLCL